MDHHRGAAVQPATEALAEEAVSALSTQVGGSHYSSRAIQPIQYIIANQLPFIEGAVVKYCTRWRDKGGIEDLKKARHLLDILIEDEGKGLFD